MSLKEIEAKLAHFNTVLSKAEEYYKLIYEIVISLTTTVEYIRMKLNISEEELIQHVRETYFKQDSAKSPNETRNAACTEAEILSGATWLDGAEHAWGDVPSGVPGQILRPSDIQTEMDRDKNS